jgi:hypothetical protein
MEFGSPPGPRLQLLRLPVDAINADAGAPSSALKSAALAELLSGRVGPSTE